MLDDPYTLDHFREPSLNALIVRPLVDRLYDAQDISIGMVTATWKFSRPPLTTVRPVYCLLANRVFFLKEQSGLANQSVNVARATLCELVATRVLRRFHENSPGQAGLLLLAHILVEGFDPFHGAPGEVEREGRHLQWPIQERGGHERKLTALELAILSESKTFISSSACQRVVDAVHRGLVIYTPISFIDMLPDHYKHRPISLYEPHDARILNHHRLIVPRIRAVVEVAQFMSLVALYCLTMINRGDSLNLWELAFGVYTAGWVLQEFAAVIEHGWELHSQSLWSFLDVTFVAIYCTYVLARIYDLIAGQVSNGYGLHVLCIAAPVLLTRIAFNLMPRNIVFISLHAMMRDFTMLTVLALWCFAGFLLALMWLLDTNPSQGGQDSPTWPIVGKWLLWIWFGLDGTGIAESVRFNFVLGPALMIAFAFLGNTLFLTILVAILTNTFSNIVANEAAEIRFRRTVLTFEGVKSDSIFAYPPPFNMLALVTILPLKFLVSPRLFHTINVAVIRLLNAPLLIAISVIERRSLWTRPKSSRNKRSFFNWQFTGFSPHGDIHAVFTTPLPDELSQKIDQLDPVGDVPVLEDDVVSILSADMSRSRLRRPGLSLSRTRREYPRARPRRRSPDADFSLQIGQQVHSDA